MGWRTGSESSGLTARRPAAAILAATLLALTAAAIPAPAASGWFVHVFVDTETQQPAGIPESIRAALERLHTGGDAAGAQR